MTTTFTAIQPSLQDYWRSIILFGRNTASYKFALASTLLELQPRSGDLLRLEDLAPVYAKHLTQHLKQSDKQAVSQSSSFLDACRQFNKGEITEEQLIKITIQLGFKNVIDAFHVVAQDNTPVAFFIDERKSNKGIRVTDELSQLLGSMQSHNLPHEVEARWNLVETAWELGVSSNLLQINYDPDTSGLFTIDHQRRRKSVTSCKDALSGYQKGKCFYCFRDINLTQVGNPDTYPDVDHFFPHTLKQYSLLPSVDGVWNLVLACQQCNRGVNGKFHRVPTIKLLERLHRRNEFLISSHHPLRETLIGQTGHSEPIRRLFLNDAHQKAHATLLHLWEAQELDQAWF